MLDVGNQTLKEVIFDNFASHSKNVAYKTNLICLHAKVFMCILPFSVHFPNKRVIYICKQAKHLEIHILKRV